MKHQKASDFMILLKYAHQIYSEIDLDEKVNEQIIKVATLYRKKIDKNKCSSKDMLKLWKYIKSFEKDDKESILEEGKQIFRRK